MPTRTAAKSGQTDDATAALRRELDEALEQQTAVAGVLQAISRSAFDLQTVLDMLVEHAARLGDSPEVMIAMEHEGQWAFVSGVHKDEADQSSPVRERVATPLPVRGGVQPGTAFRAAVDERRTVTVSGGLEGVAREYPGTAELWRVIDERGYPAIGSCVWAPLLRDDSVLGMLIVRRPSSDPYTERQVAALQTFADQAVIAIENARLFDEVQAKGQELEERNVALTESLEHQQATGEVLELVSRAPVDVQSVLDGIVERTARLCQATTAFIYFVEGNHLRRVAVHQSAGAIGGTLPSDRSWPVGVAILERRTVYFTGAVADIEQTYPGLGAFMRERGQVERTQLSVPLVRGDAVIGALVAMRLDQRGFTPAQIALVQTFADQAVIAIENARLFEEIQAKNHDLTIALDRQTATGEILRAISSAPGELTTVFETILESAHRLVGADSGAIYQYEDGRLHFAAGKNMPEEYRPRLEASDFPPNPKWPMSQCVLQGRTIQIDDMRENYDSLPSFSVPWGGRTSLNVPVRRGNDVVGAITFHRHEVQPFSAQQIALIESFADQAAIAIENARLFDALKHKSEELTVAGRAKDDFLSRMSHELRTPMNAILGFAEVLAMDPQSTPEQREWVGQILGGGRHLLGLINEVLDIARIEAGQLSLSLEPVAVADVLVEVLDLARALAVEGGVAISADDASDISVQADRQRLSQVLLNLAANGVKYNLPGGAVRVEVEQVAGDCVRLTVRDTGSGIPPEKLDRLFVPFDRLGAEQSRVEGTGLGLAIARRLVEAMGGAIGVESVVDRGSAFWVELPRATGLAGMDSASFALPPAQPATAGTLLYVEDNPANLALVSDVLRFRPGLTLLTATDGRSGLALARERRPDLILLDLNLPELSGAEVLAALREDPATRAIPVVVISADATEGQRRRLLAAGARDYLTKPLQLQRLLDLLDTVLTSDGAS